MPLKQGAYSIVPPVLTTFGWISSIVQDGCDFALIKDVDSLTQGEVPFVQAGLKAYRNPYYDAEDDKWKISIVGACIAYPEEVIDDPKWNLAKVCAFIAQVLGGAATFYLWCLTCCVFSKATWRWAGFQVFLAACFQLAGILVWFTNDLCQEGSCEWSYGMKFDVAASIFWILAAMTTFCHYPEARDLVDGEDEADGVMRPRTTPEIRIQHQDSTEGVREKERDRNSRRQQSGEESMESRHDDELL